MSSTHEELTIQNCEKLETLDQMRLENTEKLDELKNLYFEMQSDLKTTKNRIETVSEKQEKQGTRQLYQDLRERVEAMELKSDPVQLNFKIEESLQQMDKLTEKYSQLETILETLRSEKYVRIWSNNEIKALWAQSELEIEKVMKQFKVSRTQGYRLVTGEIDDILIRNRVCFWLWKICVKNQEKNNGN